jgi:Fur family zinc uptake transcriptional regulator
MARTSAAPSPYSKAEPSSEHAHALAQAETLCKASGARLTPIRRHVYEALYESQRPLGAYDLAEVLSPNGRRLAPITVYRALDFLIEQGLAHRLASKNAYIASANAAESQDTMAFLICESCGSVDEVSSQELSNSLSTLLAQKGFRPKDKVLEITGQCAHCQSGSH